MNDHTTSGALHKSASGEPNNFAMIPKMAIFELSPASLKLYCYYKQITGEAPTGECYRAINTISGETGLSSDTIRRARRDLEDRGYITTRLEGERGMQLVHVSLANVWEANRTRFAATPPVSSSVAPPSKSHTRPPSKSHTRPPSKNRRESISLDQENNNASADADDGHTEETDRGAATPPTPKSARKPDPLFDAIAAGWNTDAAGWIVTMRGMLTGTAKRGAWKTCNFDRPATPDEVAAFARWCKATERLSEMPKQPEVVQRRFYEYREWAAKRQPAPDASATPLTIGDFVLDIDFDALREQAQWQRDDEQRRRALWQSSSDDAEVTDE